MVESLRNPSLWRFLPAMIGISAAIIGGYFYNHGLFLGNSGTLVTCMAYGLLASLLLIPGFRFWKSEARNVPAVRPAKPLLWSLSALILVLILRLFNIITRYHVPNGKRSLMIAGTEVHHIIIGLFFALFILLSIYNQSLRNKSTPNLGGPLLISLALVADEISYIMIFPLTDDAFFGISSVMGVFIALAWLFIRINILKTSARPSGAY